MTSPLERYASSGLQLISHVHKARGMRIICCRLLVVAATLAISPVAASGEVGPSTTTEPYIVATHPGVQVKSILTAGDSVLGYRMVGAPDGLGAYANGDGTFTLLMAHELGERAGAVRAHGARGAFVSRWTIRARDLAVLSGRDLAQSPNDVQTFDKSSGAFRAGPDTWARFCSADLAQPSAFSYRKLGTTDRIFLTGEESAPFFSSDHGRAFAFVATGPSAGQAWELPHLGRMAFENVVASPHSQEKTLVFGMDDAGLDTDVRRPSIVCAMLGLATCTQPPSELYLYIGRKRAAGNPIERAGLANGQLYGVQVKVNGKLVPGEDPAFVFGNAAEGRVLKARFGLHDFGDVSRKTGNALQRESIEAGVTQFLRIEDGAWDPRGSNRNDFYFVTTGNLAAGMSYRASRLWRVRFDDVERPEAGGEIEVLLDSADPAGKPGFEMLDNIAIDRRGRILLQEDAGTVDRLSKIWLYDVNTKGLAMLAELNPKFFRPGEPHFLTTNKESSGVIDAAEVLGDGWFLLDVQAHYRNADPDLVQGGQLLALFVPHKIDGEMDGLEGRTKGDR